ncbi:ribonuclease H-like domain-containing protein [Limtongia smithiae]|uniref:ribonuclease H-like domain-containing protein n=1 Tax=Limtongia smithiae TaxID=1125753 RepID=UPI0034CFF95F
MHSERTSSTFFTFRLHRRYHHPRIRYTDGRMTDSVAATPPPAPIDATTAILQAVLKATQSASRLASSDLAYYAATSPDIATAAAASKARLYGIVSSLFASATAAATVSGELVEGGAEDKKRRTNKRVKIADASELGEDAWGKFGDINDTLFEKADTFLDLAKSNKRPGRAPLPNPIIPAITATNTWAPKRKYGTLRASLVDADIPKPQLLFKAQPDNHTDEPFKPLLTSKPNAKIGLAESLQLEYDDDAEVGEDEDEEVEGKGSALVYKNPYAYEIEHAKFSKSLKKKATPIASQPLEGTSPIWVRDATAVADMLEALRAVDAFAVDLEHHDYHSYIGFVCLMQISTREQDYLIDTLILRAPELEVLNEVFTNPKIVKVLHGASFDVIWLQRDFGIYVVGMFDTYYAAKVLSLEGKSLAFLLDRFCAFTAAKEYQMADWRIRPLPDVMMDYARCDTHFLLFVYDTLRNMLLDAGEDKLESVLASSRRECLKTYIRGGVYSPESGRSGARALAEKFGVPESQLPLLSSLLSFRDKVARDTDEGARYVMTNRALATLAKVVPTDLAGVARTVRGGGLSAPLQARVTDLIKILVDFDPVASARSKKSAAAPPVTKTEDIPMRTTVPMATPAADPEAERATQARRAALAMELFPSSTHISRRSRSEFWGSVFN